MSLFLLLLGVLILLNYYNYTKKFGSILISITLGFIVGSFYGNYNYEFVVESEKLIQSYDNTQEYPVVLEIDSVYKKSYFDIDYKSKVLKIGDITLEKDIYALLKTKKNFDFSAGQRIQIDSVIRPIENFNAQFDYTSYMQSKSIYTIFSSYNFENLSSKEHNTLVDKIHVIRQEILEIIHKLYPKNEAIFLGGILIGAREEIPEDLSDSFNNSGLTHLIAVSGYNITIIIVFLTYILLYFPKIIRIVLITGMIVLYTIIVGDSAAVIRAAVMGLVGYYVLMSGRKGDSLAIILFTGLLMLLFNPFLLNYDIGFQLSFLAVFGLLYTQQFFEKIFFFLPKKFAIQESFVLTLSAFVFTIPIMVYNFGQISILAPIANMIVGWTIPFAMLFGTLSIIFYKFSLPFTYLLGYGEYYLLKWTTSVATFFGGLDFAILKIEPGNYGLYFQVLYFLIIVFCILYFQKERQTMSSDSVIDKK